MRVSYRIRYIDEADGLTYQFVMGNPNAELYKALKAQSLKIWYQRWDIPDQKWINVRG